MDFRDKVFISVAESLSFSKAAEKLYISQPAISRHIKEMESARGIQLFERKGNRIYLTLAGEISYFHLKKVVQLYGELDFALGALKDEHKGILRIGASSTIAQYVIPSLLAIFHKRFPNIELDLFNGNSFEMEQKLLKNDIDLALVENNSSNNNLKYINFAEDNIVAIVGVNSPLSHQNVLDVQDLLQIPLVMREYGSGTLQVIEQAFTSSGIKFEKLPILLHLGSTEAIKNFLVNFDGIAFVSEQAIKKELLLKTLKQIFITNLSIKRFFRIALPPGPELKVPNQFVRFILSDNNRL
ncbi:MAG: LysR family transcriptional regulator [Mariniphaga sp.]